MQKEECPPTATDGTLTREKKMDVSSEMRTFLLEVDLN